jgi:short subunit dehydrogenase-like uncharacterized protein
LCVYGATGFTGTLVASYLAAHPSLPNDFKWCIAGRSEAKLKKLRAELDKETASLATWRGSALPELVAADASSPESLASLASSAKVVLTTVGPYTLYGMPLVEACAVAGTHYADLSGEFFFQADAIKNFDAAAVSSGASIVVASG